MSKEPVNCTRYQLSEQPWEVLCTDKGFTVWKILPPRAGKRNYFGFQAGLFWWGIWRKKNFKLLEFKHENSLPSYVNPATGIKLKIFVRDSAKVDVILYKIGKLAEVPLRCFLQPLFVCGGVGLGFTILTLKTASELSMSLALVCRSFSYAWAVINMLRVLITHMLPAVNIAGCSCPVPQK